MDKSELEPKIHNPFLRWTGSKRWFIKEHINDYLPESFNNYHEPFLGGGAVFFYLKSRSENRKKIFFLSDINYDLINCYTEVRDNPMAVIAKLKTYANTQEAYYIIRKSQPRLLINKAAKFIYLNRTSFNGIYRVNAKGGYNVPYGKRTNVDVVTEELLSCVSLVLQDSIFKNQCFTSSLSSIKKGDLVFIDPPYTIAHENNGFIEYNKNLFSWDDQLKLRNYVKEIVEKGAYFILTNASHQSILDLYGDIGSITKLSRLSQVGGRLKTRGLYNELVICNTRS